MHVLAQRLKYDSPHTTLSSQRPEKTYMLYTLETMEGLSTVSLVCENIPQPQNTEGNKVSDILEENC